MISSVSDMTAYILPRAVPPGPIAAQVLIQMLPAVLELITDKANTIEVGAHSEPLIFLLDFPVTGAFLRQSLMVER